MDSLVIPIKTMQAPGEAYVWAGEVTHVQVLKRNTDLSYRLHSEHQKSVNAAFYIKSQVTNQGRSCSEWPRLVTDNCPCEVGWSLTDKARFWKNQLVWQVVKQTIRIIAENGW